MDKTCRNCNFFKKHYAKRKYDFRLTDYGHCTLQPKTVIDIYDENPACKYWKSEQETEETRQKNILFALYGIIERLKMIEIILKGEQFLSPAQVVRGA